ncbi:MAG: cytochrome C [Caldilineaceae bacterium]
MPVANPLLNEDAVEDALPQLSETARLARQPSFRVSTALLIGAAVMLAISTFFPYWRMRLNAPQYPQGLFVIVYVNHMEGDVREIDGLNHYIGMKPLDNAANIERSIAPIAMVVIGLMIVSVALIHSKWFAVLAIPTMLFPFVFLADMWVWLWYYGNNLDPTAALSSSIKAFTPAILGTGHVGQFSTTATLQPGWYLALIAALLAGFGLHYRRRARLASQTASVSIAASEDGKA